MLSELEQSVYAELFQNCDSEGAGKVSGLQAFELFRQSGLPQDILQQVCILHPYPDNVLFPSRIMNTFVLKVTFFTE